MNLINEYHLIFISRCKLNQQLSPYIISNTEIAQGFVVEFGVVNEMKELINSALSITYLLIND